MDRLIERCAMLDVHKSQITACVRVPDDAGGRRQEIREFAATTSGLLTLADWLGSWAVTVVGMESTGVYWRAVFYLLEDEFECRLYNARHLRHVPGRKSDVQDAEWGCQLVEHGLVRPSFVPERPLRELRDLVRYRKAKIQERTREVQRVEKTLQDAGIKLSSVASEVLGVSARKMLDALISGTHDPAILAELAKGALRKKIPALKEALQGRFTGHHALLVGQMLAQIDFLDETIQTLSERITELTRPFSRELELLDTIPGVDTRAAEMLLAEIGPDMSRFPTEHHLASWAGMCPGQRQSGAKKHSAATRKGSKWLRGTLTECAKGIVRTKGTYLSARYHRIKSRRGHAKATIATGHKILTAAYHVLNQRVPYHELGEEFFYRRDTENTERYRRRLIHQLERLGHQVTLQPLPEAA
ncbi:MAG: IS110 family transposase [Solirubrobacteraceae bacterium]